MRVEPGDGLALKFTGVIDEDRSRLASLMNRLRQSSWFKWHNKIPNSVLRLDTFPRQPDRDQRLLWL